MTEAELVQLEELVDALTRSCERLLEDNNRLRAQMDKMQSERAGILHRQEEVRSRIEGLANRLRVIEEV